MSHVTLTADMPAFWDYSFEDIGLKDYSRMIDEILSQRVDACKKVTLVTHSSGSNAALVLASRDEFFAQKVDRIVALAPCLRLNLDDFWLPLKDRASVQAFYDLLRTSGVTSLFGADHAQQISAFCSLDAMTANICQAFLMPPFQHHLKETSVKAFQHIH